MSWCGAKRSKILCFLLLLLSLLSGVACGSAGGEDSAQGVTIFAASSMRECVEEIAREWVERGGRKPRMQFAATSTLARQIQQGAPIDVFIAAAPEWLDAADADRRRDWLSNQLVLVALKDDVSLELGSLPSLALANPQVPAGKYAMAALEASAIVMPERVLYGNSVRDVLAKVLQGGARAGVVYATDAKLAPDLRVVHSFPARNHPRIVYSIGLFGEAGDELCEQLFEPWALEIAKKHGFQELAP